MKAKLGKNGAKSTIGLLLNVIFRVGGKPVGKFTMMYWGQEKEKDERTWWKMKACLRWKDRALWIK